MIEEPLLFLGGANSDDSDRLLPKGDYRIDDTLNCRIGSSKNSLAGAVENVMGNAPVPFTLPSGQNTVMFTLEDKQGGSIIYFVHNSLGNHGIYRYYASSRQIRIVIQWSGLAFSMATPVRAAAVIDDLLYWTDNNIEPRKINLRKAENTHYNIGINKYPQPYLPEYLSRIKAPYEYPLSCSHNSTTDISDSLTGNPFKQGVQFACRFRYDDNELSVVGPYSKLQYMYTGWYDESGMNFTGDPFLPTDKPYINRLTVTLPLTFLQAKNRLIKSVQFIFREGNRGVPMIFKEVFTANGADSDTITATFENFITGSALSVDEAARGFDSSPIRSGALTIAQNRIFESDYLLGYDAPNDVNLSVTVNDNASPVALGQKTFKSRGKYKVALAYYDKARRKCTAVAVREVTIPEIYGVETSLPTRGNPDYTQLTTVSKVLRSLQFTISGTPPVWAHSYQVLLSECINIPYFLQTCCRYLFWYKRDSDSTNLEDIFYSGATLKSQKGVAFILNSGEGYTWQKGDRLRVITHYRLCAEEENALNPLSPTVHPTALRDFEIKEQRGNRILIECDLGEWIYSGNVSINAQKGLYAHAHIEIYRTATEVADERFYEVGQAYAVTNPGLNDRSHSVTSGAIKGDVYYVQQDVKFSRLFNVKIDTNPDDGNTGLDDIVLQSTTTKAFFERAHPREQFSVDWQKDIGWPNVAYQDGGQVYQPTGIRFSNQYIAGSTINGLSTFELLNEKILPVEHGPVSCLQLASNSQSEGSVLLAIQHHETMSLYLNEAQFRDTGGRQLVAISEQVIGAENTLRNGLGTRHPKSVRQHNGRVWYVDDIDSEVVRYGGDGLTPLARTYKMKNFFYNLCKVANMPGMVASFIGGYDPYHEEYILTVKEATSQFPAVTIAFSETRKRFTSKYSFIQEAYEKLNEQFFSFSSGVMYEQEANSLACNFNGEQYTAKFHFVVNANFGMDKLWNAIGIHANSLWLPVRISNDKGQLSKMFPNYFEKHESVWYGAFRRDCKTLSNPITQGEVLALVQGEELRSQILVVILENTSTSAAVMHQVVLGYIISSGHRL